MASHDEIQQQINKILFHPGQVNKTPPPTNTTDLDIEVAPGVKIGCRLFTASPEAETIIFFHGNGETVSDYDEVGQLYQKHGLNFLVTDYRGYGWSDGKPSVDNILTDAETIYRKASDWLSENQYSGKKYIMGRSLGSACAIDLVANHNEDDGIGGLIIESGFGSSIKLAKKLGIDLDEYNLSEEDTFNNLAKIARVTKPTLILHGQLDELIPAPEAEKLMAECGARHKEFFIIPGAGHNTMLGVGGDHYFLTIKKFIDKHEGHDDWRKRRKAFKEQQEKQENDQ